LGSMTRMLFLTEVAPTRVFVPADGCGLAI
jgi:hypothetical protein